MTTERDELVERLRVSAKLLRNASVGTVGEDRHWMKDCATDCENAAERIEHSASREAELSAELSRLRGLPRIAEMEKLASREAALCGALRDATDTLEDRCMHKDGGGYIECVVCCVQWYDGARHPGHQDDCPIRLAKAALSATSPAASRLLKIESAFRELTRTARLDLNANQADEMPGNWSLQHERAVVAAEALLTGAST